MSRSGYTDDNDEPLAHGRWRQAVNLGDQHDCDPALVEKREIL